MPHYHQHSSRCRYFTTLLRVSCSGPEPLPCCFPTVPVQLTADYLHQLCSVSRKLEESKALCFYFIVFSIIAFRSGIPEHHQSNKEGVQCVLNKNMFFTAKTNRFKTTYIIYWSFFILVNPENWLYRRDHMWVKVYKVKHEVNMGSGVSQGVLQHTWWSSLPLQFL